MFWQELGDYFSPVFRRKSPKDFKSHAKGFVVFYYPVEGGFLEKGPFGSIGPPLHRLNRQKGIGISPRGRDRWILTKASFLSAERTKKAGSVLRNLKLPPVLLRELVRMTSRGLPCRKAKYRLIGPVSPFWVKPLRKDTKQPRSKAPASGLLVGRNLPCQAAVKLVRSGPLFEEECGRVGKAWR